MKFRYVESIKVTFDISQSIIVAKHSGLYSVITHTKTVITFWDYLSSCSWLSQHLPPLLASVLYTYIATYKYVMYFWQWNFKDESLQMMLHTDHKTHTFQICKHTHMYGTYLLLNQARTGLWPAHTWFLRIASVCECLYACVCLCACVSATEAINN